MKKICSSCGKDLGCVPGGETSDEISHGLCDPCAIHFMADIGISLDEFIEAIEAPVVTISETGLVAAANRSALQLLGKDIAQIEGLRGGDVFECEHALLPGGCGQTIHCSGCAIRSTVFDTLKSGKAHQNVPAFLDHNEPSGSRRVNMLISTKKKGGVVFLSVKMLD